MSVSQATQGAVAHVEAPQCLICGTALSGPLGAMFRVAGITRSSRNSNLCNRCNTHTEEGRLVELTVLFADLSSFTELTHELGPEKTHEVVDAFLKAATYALVKHGAFIDKYVGDAVMAFFNAPIRYENHSARAVAAALDIQAELPALAERFGLNLRASIGIASGWARVGRLGSGDGKDYTAIGDVVNLAARLEGQARAGEVVIDADVFKQVAEQYPSLPEESLPLKGFPEPVPAYRLNAAPDSPHASTRSVYDADGPTGRRRAASLGGIIFALLGAPCAAGSLIGPLAVVLGFASVFGAFTASTLAFLDQGPIRVPLLTLATIFALANLYTIWHARQLRKRAEAQGQLVCVTGQERRRTIMVMSTSILTLLAVAFELYAHHVLLQHSVF